MMYESFVLFKLKVLNDSGTFLIKLEGRVSTSNIYIQ